MRFSKIHLRRSPIVSLVIGMFCQGFVNAAQAQEAAPVVLSADAQAVVDAYPLPDAADNGLVLLLSTVPESGWPRSRSIEAVAASLGTSVDALTGPPIESFTEFAARTYVDRDIRREVLEDVRGGLWSAKRYPEIAAWLEAQSEGLAVVRASLDRAAWQAPIWVPDGELGPTLMIDQRHGGVVIDLLLIAAHEALDRQDVDAAWQYLETGQRLAARMSQGPYVVDKHRAAEHTRALWGAVRRWCGMDAVDDETVEAALSALLTDPWSHTPLTEDLTRAEIPLTRSVIDAASRGVPVDDLIEVEIGELSISDGVVYERWQLEAVKILTELSQAAEATTRSELAAELKVLIEQTAPLTDDSERLAEQLAGLPAADDAAYASAATEMLIAYSARVIEQVRTARILQLNHEANRRVVIAALAARRYFAAHEAYPSKLEKLIPELLSEAQSNLLVDPLSGELLRYSTSGSGFQVNSVGVDGQNDLGRDDDPTVVVGRARRAA